MMPYGLASLYMQSSGGFPAMQYPQVNMSGGFPAMGLNAYTGGGYAPMGFQANTGGGFPAMPTLPSASMSGGLPPHGYPSIQAPTSDPPSLYQRFGGGNFHPGVRFGNPAFQAYR